MTTKFTFCFAVILCSIISSAVRAAETGQILFFNPVPRESAARPEVSAMRFVTVDGFAPFSSFDANGALRGIHVDLARTICTEIKLSAECTLQMIDFDEVENVLISGQADVALSGIIPTQQNRNNLSFSFPYFRYPAKFLSKTGQNLPKGAVIGVISGSVHQKMAEALFPQLKRVTFTNENEATKALQSEAVSAIFSDGMQLALLKGTGNFDCCKLGVENYFLPKLRPDTLRAAVSNKKPDILALVDSALRQISMDGRLDEIFLRHMPVNPLK